ncbi:MAG TPA: cation:proton antiporter [Acidimicrobiales bacterium]|nr:cation:proton antiporter [Acidimicrobiales bacterium]
MTSTAVATLVLIALAAVLAPIISELTGRLAIPEIVIQIVLGILMGPYVFGLAHVGTVVTGLSDLGLTYLIFLAGYELDLDKIRGTPLRLATLGWAISLVIGLAAAFSLVSAGLARDTLVVGLALTTTAMGTLAPILRDAGVTDTRFGAHISAVGTVGEFGPIVAVALLLTNKDPLITSLLLVAFITVAVVTVLVAARGQPPRVVSILNRHLESSAQLPVRVSLLFIVLLVLLAETLGLDVLLGAFAAGIVVRLFSASSESDAIKAKLEAIGFGFLIPIFFVVSGIDFDLHVFIQHPSSLWRVPVFLVLMLVARGAPAYLLYRKTLTPAQRLPMALFSATGLPLIVVITSIALEEHRMLEVNAASLVAAGMLSVMVFPALGLSKLKGSGVTGEPQGSPA